MLPEWVLWTLTGLLILLGILGTLIPFLPGMFLVVLAAFIHLFPEISPHPLSFFQFGVIFALFLLGILIEYFFGFIGAKVGGVSRAGLFMGMAGMLLGLFTGPWGILLGPLLGVFVGEMIISNKSPLASFKSSLGYLAGNLTGLLFKLILVLIMSALLVWFLLKGTAPTL